VSPYLAHFFEGAVQTALTVQLPAAYHQLITNEFAAEARALGKQNAIQKIEKVIERVYKNTHFRKTQKQIACN
jgi:hypothetical protein